MGSRSPTSASTVRGGDNITLWPLALADLVGRIEIKHTEFKRLSAGKSPTFNCFFRQRHEPCGRPVRTCRLDRHRALTRLQAWQASCCRRSRAVQARPCGPRAARRHLGFGGGAPGGGSDRKNSRKRCLVTRRTRSPGRPHGWETFLLHWAVVPAIREASEKLGGAGVRRASRLKYLSPMLRTNQEVTPAGRHPARRRGRRPRKHWRVISPSWMDQAKRNGRSHSTGRGCTTRGEL